MSGGSGNGNAGQGQSAEKTSSNDVILSWLTLPNIVACLIIVGYGVFLIYMLRMVSVPEETIWMRTTYLLNGFEAIAFAAAGYLFGKEVHRQQAENAEKRADKAQDEASDAQDSANEALTKGYRLTEAVKARAAAQSGMELKAKSIGGPSGESESTQGDLDYLASMADELFPLNPK
jgi:hypothetical protein